ncbi:uncharacterized protein [Porites lutea]|uniref:uncharacterized protein isoform X1 n=1 Tax=Porites lutea TaxID=51062 RepID=UPI003CC5668C
MSRLTALFILLVVISICAAKSSKKTAKSKSSKVIKIHKHKDAEHKNNKGHKASTAKKHDSVKKESKQHKSADNATNKTLPADKSSNATADNKIANKTTVTKNGNKTQAILAQGTPSDCQSIVEDYSKGKLLMYEYKIQMKRCMNKAKEGASTADAKSALLRPDDSSTEEDSHQAVNVRPYNEHVTDEENDNNHDEFHENDNDNDYNDDDDDDDEDPEEKPEKKMEVPGLMGYQSLNAPMMNYNMVPQQQAAAVPELQTANFYPTMDQAQSLNAAVPQQNQEAFAPSAINQYQANPVPFQSTVPNMAMNLAVAKSNIPGNTQNTASQANAVFDQWRASSFGATTADKKDQTPNAPAVPANDPFAEFMKMQSTSGNSLEALPARQQAAMTAAVEQRSNIPQQPPSMSVPMQPQITNTVPSQSQAFYVQPQENEDFPKNP